VPAVGEVDAFLKM